MSDIKDKSKELDDFWELSALVPPRPRRRPAPRSTDTVEIIEGTAYTSGMEDRNVIKRFIPPHSELETSRAEEPALVYTPKNSLIHRVSLYKRSSRYAFYADFCNTARELWSKEGTQCEYVELFSYMPQYDLLSEEQLSYYLWWRTNVRRGEYIRTDTAYIRLYMNELINAWDMTSPNEARRQMICVILNYTGLFRGSLSLYVKWIIDFSLLHRLEPPQEFSEELLKNALSLKEYFAVVSGTGSDALAATLLRYCCSYDYKTSKFATGDALALYDVHVPRALAKAVEYLSVDGRVLSSLPFDDCRKAVNAFDGALCSSDNRYRIEVEYCSFSRSHELRFLVGDIVKYCENKLRAYIGVKSRLTVYSLPNDVRDVIDGYFAEALPTRRRAVKQKPETHEYDALYELPKKELDLSNAAQIELASWQTTRALVEAFGGAKEAESTAEEPKASTESRDDEGLKAMAVSEPVAEPEEAPSLRTALGKYYAAVAELRDGSAEALYSLSRELARPVEALADEINEIAVELIGDVLLEESENGYGVISEYADMLRRL